MISRCTNSLFGCGRLGGVRGKILMRASGQNVPRARQRQQQWQGRSPSRGFPNVAAVSFAPRHAATASVLGATDLVQQEERHEQIQGPDRHGSGDRFCSQPTRIGGKPMRIMRFSCKNKSSESSGVANPNCLRTSTVFRAFSGFMAIQISMSPVARG